MPKRHLAIFLALTALVLAGAGCVAYPAANLAPASNQAGQPANGPLLGGDRDEHGCIGSAGYSWCASKNKCLRIWEEECPSAAVNEPEQTTAAETEPTEPQAPRAGEDENALTPAIAEQACKSSGGTVSSAMCCQSSGDFPNSCLIGACGCAPSYSHSVKTCDCGEGKCFDGRKCVGR